MDATDVNFQPLATSSVTKERNLEPQQNHTVRNVGLNLRVLLLAMAILPMKSVQNRGRHQRVQADRRDEMYHDKHNSDHTRFLNLRMVSLLPCAHIPVCVLARSGSYIGHMALYVAFLFTNSDWKRYPKNWLDCLYSLM
jgi:hypothetical protein